MNEFFKILNEDKLLRRGYFINLISILICLVYILLYFRGLPPFIPLFNQFPWGEQRIVKTVWIFLMPTLALLILAINFMASGIFYRKNPLIPRLFWATSFMISFLTLLFVIRTIQTVL